MDYPDWTPRVLVECLRGIRNIDSRRQRESINAADSEPAVGDAAEPHKNITEEESDRTFRRRLGLQMVFSGEENKELLGRLLTDYRMKDVWNALARRATDDENFFAFLFACHKGLHSWEREPKHTAAERKVFSREIQDTVTKLDDLMKKSGLFDHYSIQRLMGDQTISALLNDLGSTKRVIYGRISIVGCLPKVSDILSDMSRVAKRYGEEKPSVMRPSFDNANIRYFVRKISQYLQQEYKQPLHDVVSATTEVVFDRQNISSDYVRELVRRYP